jgi:hypothetical protein
LERPDLELPAVHRVALELEVDEHLDQVEPEDWDLQNLLFAMRAGLARPLRTIRGLVVDSEHDRLSTTLHAVAEDIDEAVQLRWLATASRSAVVALSLTACRPSLELLIELEHLAGLTRRVALHLRQQDL